MTLSTEYPFPTNRLVFIMGGAEAAMEMADLIERPPFREALIELGRLYATPPSEGRELPPELWRRLDLLWGMTRMMCYNRGTVFAGKPVIGIAGGIGSGKSHVARVFGQFGCLVLDADQQVSQAYELPEVRQALRSWWGEEVINSHGQIERAAIARRVFSDPTERRRLESLLHPIVRRLSGEAMAASANSAQVLAFVWDAPLLFEAGLHRECDAVVFVEAPWAVRLARVQRSRQWSEQDLLLREKSQLPLDNKREMSDYIIRNTTDADDEVRHQVRDVLSQILVRAKARDVQGNA